MTGNQEAARFNKEEFIRFILENNIVGFFKSPVKLSSGRESHWYVNWRNVLADAYLTEQVVKHVLDFVDDLGLKPGCFFGIPAGASKLGIMTQAEWARRSPDYGPGTHVLSMGREIPKEHGLPKDRYFVGEPAGNAVVLEDTTTTGRSLVSGIYSLEEAGFPVIAAITLTDRMELNDDRSSVTEVMEAKGISYYAMSNAFDLLPAAYRALNPGEDLARAVEREFFEHGIMPIKLS